MRQRNRSPGPKETWVIKVDWQLQGQMCPELPLLHSGALVCCCSINLARYIYSSDSQREEWFEVGASAKSTMLFAPLPEKPVLILGQLGQKVSFPGRICRQKKSPGSCALEMFRRWQLQFMFDLNLSPRPTSHLGGSGHCPASETSGFQWLLPLC